MKNIQVVVLLGGLGTRLRILTKNMPKPMINIYGKPFIYYQLKLMLKYGLRNYIFCIGYKGDKIRNYFGNGAKFGINIKYSIESNKLLGTAGAIRRALNLLNNEFLIIYGDSYMDVNYLDIIDYYCKIKNNNNGLMVIYRNENKYDKSNIQFKNKKIVVYDKRYYSKNMEYIDYGISILKKINIININENQSVDLSEIYSKLINNNQMAAYVVKRRFYEIGNLKSLYEFRKYINNKK